MKTTADNIKSKMLATPRTKNFILLRDLLVIIEDESVREKVKKMPRRHTDKGSAVYAPTVMKMMKTKKEEPSLCSVFARRRGRPHKFFPSDVIDDIIKQLEEQAVNGWVDRCVAANIISEKTIAYSDWVCRKNPEDGRNHGYDPIYIRNMLHHEVSYSFNKKLKRDGFKLDQLKRWLEARRDKNLPGPSNPSPDLNRQRLLGLIASAESLLKKMIEAVK